MSISAMPFPYYLVELPIAQCVASVAQLANLCAWFQYTPQPYDRGQIIVKNERGPKEVLQAFQPRYSTFLTRQQFQETTSR